MKAYLAFGFAFMAFLGSVDKVSAQQAPSVQITPIEQTFAQFPTYLKDQYIDPSSDKLEIQGLIKKFLDGEISIDSIRGNGIWVTLSGGDIIGNGGGLIEAYFYSGLGSIKTYVDACLKAVKCQVSKEERSLLSRISVIAENNKKMRFSLIFVDKNLGQNLFVNTDFSRVAMTGHRPGYPIFINKNKAYDVNGNPQLSRKEVISVLIHELGHQGGVRNHSQLDRLGEKVASLVTQGELSIQLRDRDSGAVEFWIEGSQGSIDSLVAQVAIDDKVKNLSESLKSKVTCPEGFSLYGFSVSNLHWLRSSAQMRTGELPDVGMWVDLQCIENATGGIHDFSIDIQQSL